MTALQNPLPHAASAAGIGAGRSYAAEAVLLLFALLSVGVLDPQLDAVNFDKLTVQAAVAETSTTGAYNQLRWLLLAGLACLPVLREPDPLLAASWRAWPLLLLLAFCVLSAAWSSHPEVTLRRAFGLIVPAYCLIVAITYLDRPERAAVIVYLAFWCALLVNLTFLPLPVAFDELGFFRGAAGNKNTLGSLGALAILLGLTVGSWLRSSWLRLLQCIYLIAWTGVLALTVSRSSIALVLIVPVVFVLLDAAARLLRLELGIVGLALAALAAILLAICYFAAEHAVLDLLRALSPDTFLSGRPQIWELMLRQIRDTWPIGTGFGALWGVGYSAPNLQSIHVYIRLINQGHNGYLDVAAQLGAAGLVLLSLVVAHFSWNAGRLRRGHAALYRLAWLIVLFALLHNMMESTLLVPFSGPWHLTLLAILIAARAGAEDISSWSH